MAERVRHNPDPNAQDSAFVGGSKEGLPDQWAFTTEKNGVSPPKANILDAWESIEQRGPDKFMYLAFARGGPGTRRERAASVFLTFELNHDGRLWTNEAGAQIPCRRTGDMLISYQAEGSDFEVIVQRWVTTSYDPATGCARAGHLEGYSGMTDGTDAQGAINDAAITNRLPGFYEEEGTVPRERFGESALNLTRILGAGFEDRCMAFSSIWMHSRSSTSEQANMQDYLAPTALPVRTCSASGVKFFDSDADGVRDGDEPGVEHFEVWADYDSDGARDAEEPFAVTDKQGQYVIYDIRPPAGTYTLREKPHAGSPAVSPNWRCSFPHAGTPGGGAAFPGGQLSCGWGPINVMSTPNATGKDFGNWFPAQLTVEKVLGPAGAPGAFDLLVGDGVVLPAAVNGSRQTVEVPPDTYTVSERPAGTTNAADFQSSVWCRRTVSRVGRLRTGTVSDQLELAAGQRGTCTFINLYDPPPPGPAVPLLVIRKTGPGTATAGETLSYSLLVVNLGEVAFPAGDVTVTDETCDDPPQISSKQDADGPDGSPGSLDPGDRWTYECSRTTAAADDCELSVLDNTATVVGTVPGGAPVTDEDEISTVLRCPERPLPPEPEPIDPPGPVDPVVPGPVQPPGPPVPDAGEAGIAGLQVGQRRGCVPRAARVPVPVAGRRVASVRVYVDGRLRRTLSWRTLQRLSLVRVRLAPGRHRIVARVRFQRGSGTPPVRLARTVRVCVPRRPRPCPAGSRSRGRAVR